MISFVSPPLLLAFLALAACSKPGNIECPAAQMSANGVLADTSADMAAYGERFASGYSGNAIPEAIRSVRQQYPAATNAEVRNFLIAAYCPVAKRSAVGESAQRASLQQFETALGGNLQQ